MAIKQANKEARTNSSADEFQNRAPAVSLPKGGGAIRGMGEKFAANPVTGTGSLSVPIFTSPGRSRFGPQLSLSYDSGAGNGPFGLGWNLSNPSITRKTDKGLPQYNDADESDVFILSGAEDLVPVLKPDGTRDDDDTTAAGYTIRRYRPRIEGLFARIERWTRQSDGDVHWRSISKDNILTLYGKDADSRIADPEDPVRIFTWSICETRDDKGNAVIYQYKSEGGSGVDLAQAHERNRGGRDDCRRAVNRYLKRIFYGNRVPLLDDTGQRPRLLTDAQIKNAGWMFEVVFDYGEHDEANPHPSDDAGDPATKSKPWPVRNDPFSTYRAGFEVRTYRLCQRVLMFHHIPDITDATGNTIEGYEGLVRSTDFNYSYEKNPSDARNPILSFLMSVTQTGYKHQETGAGYLNKSLPPVEFTYSEATIQKEIREVDPASLENLPSGLDGSAYQWVDLDGEGLSGILTEQGGGWFYKRNLSPINIVADNDTAHIEARFAPVELVAAKPVSGLATGHAQFMDLAGDGQPDLVTFRGPTPGFYERTPDAGSWEPFTPFASLPVLDWDDPNLKFVDLTGDGHADIVITEDDVFRWHPSLAEEGFGPQETSRQSRDEETGPHLVFADGTQSIYLADLSGDGLTDLVRIRNGEVCYWPNLGYGRFGAKVTMDNSPWFDFPDQFDQKRIRLADVDGSGLTDIVYLHGDGVRIYFNQSGNSWSQPATVPAFPRIDRQTSVTVVDLLGNGTACLVWSSALPGDARAPMRYIDLMGGQKPHLLVKTANNLGAETVVSYAPSTKFYLQDQLAGKPWITKLPFPVNVVESVETYDHISRNRFVTRYAYHHGYFDGVEREFRGFGMVEQWDTEQMPALVESDAFPVGNNVAAESHVPPVHTKTWFHTGVYLDRDHVSDFFAGLLNADQGEYFREPGLTDAEARELLLPDTVLPPGLTLEEERQACRSLKGSMLRQEVYALDGSDREPYPYSVTEQNFTIGVLQPQAGNRHAVFFTHAREAINFHYERNPSDPRIQHALTLDVDQYGNVLKSLAIGYGRRAGMSPLSGDDKTEQEQLLVTYTENDYTENDPTTPQDWLETHRTPLPCETRTYELTGFELKADAKRFAFDEFAEDDFIALSALNEAAYETLVEPAVKAKRLIECVRTCYRRNDLTALLPKGTLQSLALPGESYKLAFTPGLLDQVYVRSGQKLLSASPADVLERGGADRGGYLDLDGNGHWWIPSGRSFFSIDPADSAAAELAEARQHFFLPRRYRDPFDEDATVNYAYDLLVVETSDALGNRVTVDENDYRVLQPRLISDPNRNQTAVDFDTLGMVAGTAVMGKPWPAATEGDSLEGFVADLSQAQTDDFFDKPREAHSSGKRGVPSQIARDLLGSATTRIVYDLERFTNCGEPAFAATLARETHVSELAAGEQTEIQISFSYSDGFGREIQKKIQAEPGPVAEGGPDVNPRWVGSGWTVFNNKGKPVRQYEPFFSTLPERRHSFEFARKEGVSPVLFYDPVERVVATLHPNDTYEKVVFDPWQQTTYDVNDTVAPRNNTQTGDPRTDLDIKGYVEEYFKILPVDPARPWQTWYQQRIDGAMGPHEQAAAQKAAAHADTATTVHFDALGRPFLTIARTRVVCANHALDGTEDEFATRIELDIEGNQRSVKDERRKQDGTLEQRIVMRYAYSIAGPEQDEDGKPTHTNRIHQASMEAGERWTLNDVTGKPIRSWDSRGHDFTTAYDALRRPVEHYVRGTTDDSDPRTRKEEPLLVDKIEYGESQTGAEDLNLRTRVYRHSDSAGVATNAQLDDKSNPTEAYDFKGNLLRSTRQLVSDYKAIPDWSLEPTLDNETFASRTCYDALNRPIQSIAPHSSLERAKRNIIQPVFNEANLLERVYVWLDRPVEPNKLLDPAIDSPSPIGINNIDYDAKGQRQRIDYKNGATTRYTYDEKTFRLIHLYTRRGTTFTLDCDNAVPPPDTIAAPETPPEKRYCGLQNLHYTYDPAGNITHIQDDAQQTIYFKNQRVEPSNDYTYDAIYRLIEATGREHLGQGREPIPHSHNDAGRVGVLSADAAGRFAPNDRSAMDRYCEKYVYDEVGNIQAMSHHRSCPIAPSWTRTYAYDEISLIEDGINVMPRKTSNRLSSTTVGSGNPVSERYAYDAHGNMIRMPHLGGAHPAPNMHWDYGDQLGQTDLGGGGTAYYVYDAVGQRVRKVWEKPANLIEERIYLGGFEIFRRRQGAERLQRETLHIMDDKQRIALVETRTLDSAGNDPAPQQLIRYEFGNHLGSASLELDDQAQIISYEEYTPYGSSSYQAVRSQTETAKRYRYTGKERDEETGLSYHGARYYTPWLGRWTSCDPAELADGSNQYQYTSDCPTRFVDHTGKQKSNPEVSPGWLDRYFQYERLEPDTRSGAALVRRLFSPEELRSFRDFKAQIERNLSRRDEKPAFREQRTGPIERYEDPRITLQKTAQEQAVINSSLAAGGTHFFRSTFMGDSFEQAMARARVVGTLSDVGFGFGLAFLNRGTASQRIELSQGVPEYINPAESLPKLKVDPLWLIKPAIPRAEGVLEYAKPKASSPSSKPVPHSSEPTNPKIYQECAPREDLTTEIVIKIKVSNVKIGTKLFAIQSRNAKDVAP